MDVAGQDATDAFEDVGHSDEAREILKGLLVGKLKRQVRLSLPLLSLTLPAPCPFPFPLTHATTSSLSIPIALNSLLPSR